MFLIAEGKDTGYPNYSDATIYFKFDEPSTLSFKNTIICSPLFSIIDNGADSLPEINHGTMITFIMMPRIFPDMGDLIKENSITNQAWFSLGLANLVIIDNEKSGKFTESVIDFLKQKDNITASETWIINKGKIIEHTLPFSKKEHKTVEVEELNLIVSDKLPLHIKFAVSEFKISANKLLTASKKFTPFYYKKHFKTVDASQQLINDLSFLHGDFDFIPDDSLINEIGAKDLAEAMKLVSDGEVKTRKEELINDRNGRLIQLNSSLSYVYSQSFAGIFPLFDHVGIIQRHSLLGVGSAISALTELLDQIEGGLYILPFEEISQCAYSNHSIQSDKFYPCFQETYFHDSLHWQNDVVKNSVTKSFEIQNNSKKLPEDFFNRFAFFSGRLGFREYDLSATAAIQVLVEANSLQWNIINYTHEIIHNHVRIILNQLLVPAISERTDKYETWLSTNLKKLRDIYISISKEKLPADISYKDYFTLILIKFCINYQYYGSLSLKSNQPLLNELRADPSKKKKYNLPTFSELSEIIIDLYKDITEIFVHVLDYCYIYTRDIKTYLQSIWASWSTVIAVSNDLKQYVLRSLVVIGLTEQGAMEYRFERSKIILNGLLEKIAQQNGNAYLFSRIKELLDDKDTSDLKDRFCNCIIVGDLAYNFFVGELEKKFDNSDLNRISNYSDDQGNRSAYDVERNSFKGNHIKSKVRFLLDQLIKETIDSTSNYSDDYKERTSAWLLLSLSSFN